MEAYQHLYSDPRSPLSPIPPMMDQSLNCNLMKTTPVIAGNRVNPRALAQRAQKQAVNAVKSQDVRRKPLIRIENLQGEVFYHGQSPGAFLHPLDSKLLQKRAETKNAASGCQHQCNCQKQRQQQQQQKPQLRVFRQASPVAARALSPRMDNILKEAGLYRYAPLLRKEEIDYPVFQMLLEKDLSYLGIDQRDIPNFMNTIKKVSR
ncbi:hypothetical protein ACFFRR_003895 [Megaselia abdita]